MMNCCKSLVSQKLNGISPNSQKEYIIGSYGLFSREHPFYFVFALQHTSLQCNCFCKPTYVWLLFPPEAGTLIEFRCFSGRALPLQIPFQIWRVGQCIYRTSGILLHLWCLAAESGFCQRDISITTQCHSARCISFLRKRDRRLSLRIWVVLKTITSDGWTVWRHLRNNMMISEFFVDRRGSGSVLLPCPA